MQETKKEPGIMSDLDFRFMSLFYKIRDLYRPRSHILEEVGIKTCFHVLDYGCGPGSYVIPVIQSIGDIGMLYALDIHPLAVKSVQKLAVKKKLANVKPILSDCNTGLPPTSIDVVLLYDILHYLENLAEVLTELHRVLKPEGTLSISDHHLNDDEIISLVTKGAFFKLKSKGKRTLSFSKDKQ